MSCHLVVRIIVQVCAVVALAVAVAGTVLPFFTMPSNVTDRIAALNDTIHETGFSLTIDASVLAEFNMLVSGAPADSKMTLWELTSGSEKINLRENYFTCYTGNILIQAAQGLGVVTCVLSGANFIMASFLFLFSSVVKFPLSLYFFLSAAAAAITISIALHLYFRGWCGMRPLQTTEWELSFGFGLYVTSAATSLIACVLTMFAD